MQVKFTRHVSPSERGYLAMSLAGEMMFMQFMVTGRGQISVTQLKRAIQKAEESSPGGSLVYHKKRWVTSGLEIPVRELKKNILLNDEVLKRKFTPLSKPGTEVFIYNSMERTQILFRIFHGTMDGAGAVIWLKNVFLALKSGELYQARDSISDTEFVTQIPHHLKIPLNIKASCRLKPTPKIKSMVWHITRMDEVKTGLLAQAGVEMAQALNINAPTFMIPSNMRRHNPKVKSTANLTNTLLLSLKPGESWEVLQLKLLEALKHKHDLNLNALNHPMLRLTPLPLLAIIFRILRPVQAIFKRYIYHIFLSHLGKIALVDFSTDFFVATDFLSLPMPHSFGPLMIQVLEVDSKSVVLYLAPKKLIF